ncbi:MAG: transketolase [Acidobacteriota bacterium]
MSEPLAGGPSPDDRIAIDTIRFLAVDMVEEANSGHPGAPMAQAPMAYWLWTRHLRHNPDDPNWVNRDRFVLSCGHASALIYALLHLSGYGLLLSELRRFRQLGSQTPGHPEYGHTAGVETTTGPLGQGLATAVGMAMAEQLLAAQFNRDGYALIDHRTWVIASDGDLMEGVTSEACSLAGHLQLGKLNVLYDANRISIDGSTDLTFTEDVAARYRAYGWHVVTVEDGENLEQLDAAMRAAVDEATKPSLIVVRTEIGFGSPNKQGTASAHGAPLGGDETKATKAALGWPAEPTFHVPEAAARAFASIRQRGAEAEADWRQLHGQYRKAHPDAAADFDARQRGALPDGWDDLLPRFQESDAPVATRKVSGLVLNAISDRLPQLVGGSADLAGSNNTLLAGSTIFSPAARRGRNLYFGVREHAMGAILNGLALSGMLRPYGGTFLVFSDYMRPAMRLAALMGQPVVYVMTHDSIFLGEDGPTHQPVEHLAALRAIPRLDVMRPADAAETVEAWRQALVRRDGPTVLALTRQKLPLLPGAIEGARSGVARGAYVLADPPEDVATRALLLASGSEVTLIHEAHKVLLADGIGTRVISAPCWRRFDAQDEHYRASVITPSVKARVAVEAGCSLGWHRYVGDHGTIIAQDDFGASAPHNNLAEHFGFTVETVVDAVRQLLR